MLNKTMIATIFSLLHLITNNSASANPLVISPQPVHVNTPLLNLINASDIDKILNVNHQQVFIPTIDTSKIPPINSSNTQSNYNYFEPNYNYFEPNYNQTQSTTSQPIDINIDIPCWEEKMKVIGNKIVCDNE